jgi:hypothetical protein
MPLEAVWRKWLASAEGFVPATQAHQACRAGAATQALFRLYAHAPRSFPGWPEGSLWEGARIPERLDTRWGDHSLSAAARALLAAALADHRNRRFVLLSESDLPLYDPLTTHQQLLAQRRSMINACPGGAELMPHRWSPRMETPRLRAEHWRKSNQWWALTREHAELVVEDDEVYPM